MDTQKQNDDLIEAKTFNKRNDFYWQSTAVYALALIFYVLLRGTIYEWTVSFVLLDPVALLFACFIVISLFGLVYSLYKNHKIIVGNDFIIFKTRFREKKYTLDNIQKISFSREKVSRVRWHFNVIKIKVDSRKRFIRIRPSSFQNEKELIKSIQSLQEKIGKRT